MKTRRSLILITIWAVFAGAVAVEAQTRPRRVAPPDTLLGPEPKTPPATDKNAPLLDVKPAKPVGSAPVSSDTTHAYQLFQQKQYAAAAAEAKQIAAADPANAEAWKLAGFSEFYLKQYADACFYISDRKNLFEETRKHRQELHGRLKEIFMATPDFASQLGLDSTLDFEVHELRRSIRVGPDGQQIPQIIAALIQSRALEIDGSSESQTFRGGSTLIVDLSKPAVQYAIIKRIDSETRQLRTASFLKDALQDPLRALLIDPRRPEPFAALHSLADVEGF